MYIRIWNENEFLSQLNNGTYEDLIQQCEQWMEENYVITRSKVPSDMDYNVAKRASALKIIAQEAKLIWDNDRSNYYDTYHKLIMRLDEKREKGLLYKVKHRYSSGSSSTSSSDSSSDPKPSEPVKPGGCLKNILIFLAVIAVIGFIIFEFFTVKVFMVTEQVQVGQLNEHTVYTYDDVGRLLEVAQLDAEGNKISCTKYEFSSIGEPEGSATYTVTDGEETLVYKSEYETAPSFYIIRDQQKDPQGNKTQRIAHALKFNGLKEETYQFEGEEKVLRITYEYDRKNLVKKTTYGFENGEEYEMSVMEYTYDGNNKTGQKFYAAGVLNNQTTYTYDGKLLTEETLQGFDAEGQVTITQRIVYEYDSDGHLEKFTTYIEDEILEYSLVKCDENGNIIECASYTAGSETADQTTTYSYASFRMRTTKANRLQRERGEDLVIIDKGWF